MLAGTLGQGLIPDPPKTNNLGAPTAQEVAVKITEAMSRMDQDIRKGEEDIETTFRNISESVATGRKKDGILGVPVPNVSVAGPGDVTDGSLRPRG